MIAHIMKSMMTVEVIAEMSLLPITHTNITRQLKMMKVLQKMQSGLTGVHGRIVMLNVPIMVILVVNGVREAVNMLQTTLRPKSVLDHAHQVAMSSLENVSQHHHHVQSGPNGASGPNVHQAVVPDKDEEKEHACMVESVREKRLNWKIGKSLNQRLGPAVGVWSQRAITKIFILV